MSFKSQIKDARLWLLGYDPGFMRLYYQHFYRPKPQTLAAYIDEKTQGIADFRFLQIGGNDGFVNDPIFKFVKRYRWHGIIVEPQKDVFVRRLCKTYRHEKKVILENQAIAEENGHKNLYKLAISSSRWATGLATFNRKTLEYQIERNYVADRARREGITLPENVDDYITIEKVPCSTISHLLSKHQFAKLDLLQIDTEGFDYEIIKTIDFSVLKPTIISFENEHLSADDLIHCVKLLEHNGYKVHHIDRDSVATLN
jgi:FkbM family methyltransferase